MADEARQTAGNILSGIGGALTSVAPLATGPWKIALTGIGAAVAFVGDLIAHGLDPVVAITEMRSALPDKQAARDRLDELINQKARKP